MRRVIKTDEPNSIDWNARGVARVVQNVRNLLMLVRYEVAFNRTLGLPPELVDQPASQAAQQYHAEIIDLIEENEPRATVESIEYMGVAENGQMIFEVVMEIVA